MDTPTAPSQRPKRLRWLVAIIAAAALVFSAVDARLTVRSVVHAAAGVGKAKERQGLTSSASSGSTWFHRLIGGEGPETTEGVAVVQPREQGAAPRNSSLDVEPHDSASAPTVRNESLELAAAREPKREAAEATTPRAEDPSKRCAPSRRDGRFGRLVVVLVTGSYHRNCSGGPPKHPCAPDRLDLIEAAVGAAGGGGGDGSGGWLRGVKHVIVSNHPWPPLGVRGFHEAFALHTAAATGSSTGSATGSATGFATGSATGSATDADEGAGAGAGVGAGLRGGSQRADSPKALPPPPNLAPPRRALRAGGPTETAFQNHAMVAGVLIANATFAGDFDWMVRATSDLARRLPNVALRCWYVAITTSTGTTSLYPF